MKTKKQLILFLIFLVFAFYNGIAQETPRDTIIIDFENLISSKKGVFAPSSTFNDEQLAISFSKDFLSNTWDHSKDYLESDLPSLSVSAERGINPHMGLALSYGLDRWKDNDYSYTYNYHTFSLRANYHFNLSEKVDLYVGPAISFRTLIFTHKNEKIENDYREINSTLTFNGVIGARLYLIPSIGIHFEYANDLTSYLRTGITFRFNSSSPKTETS